MRKRSRTKKAFICTLVVFAYSVITFTAFHVPTVEADRGGLFMTLYIEVTGIGYWVTPKVSCSVGWSSFVLMPPKNSWRLQFEASRHRGLDCRVECHNVKYPESVNTFRIVCDNTSMGDGVLYCGAVKESGDFESTITPHDTWARTMRIHVLDTSTD